MRQALNHHSTHTVQSLVRLHVHWGTRTYTADRVALRTGERPGCVPSSLSPAPPGVDCGDASADTGTASCCACRCTCTVENTACVSSLYCARTQAATVHIFQHAGQCGRDHDVVIATHVCVLGSGAGCVNTGTPEAHVQPAADAVQHALAAAHQGRPTPASSAPVHQSSSKRCSTVACTPLVCMHSMQLSLTGQSDCRHTQAGPMPFLAVSCCIGHCEA